MKLKTKIGLLTLGLATMLSCSKTDDDSSSSSDNLTLDITGLENLGDKAQYEGWILVDGKAVSTGTFTVDDDKKMSKTSFIVDKDKLDKATKFILTIEPKPDTDATPTKTHIIAGNFSDKSATLGMKGALIEATADFSKNTVKGHYVLATPSNNSPNPPSQEESGVWFFSVDGTTKKAITLPLISSGWRYEGWVVVEGKPLSTGTFRRADGADEDGNRYADDKTKAPAFPGEDFLKNAPTGFTFPLDIRGGKVVISLEPNPDNSDKPFFIKPVVSNVSKTAELNKPIALDFNAVNISGTATRK